MTFGGVYKPWQRGLKRHLPVSAVSYDQIPLHCVFMRTSEAARIEDTGFAGGTGKLTLLAAPSQAQPCGDEGQ